MSTVPKQLKVLLLDPSLFTAAYDIELNNGLRLAHADTSWAVREARFDEKIAFSRDKIAFNFYRSVELFPISKPGLRGLAKGLSHLGGLLRLIFYVFKKKPDVVHFQWAVLPFADSIAMLIVRQMSVVVMTVHDTVPFNGERISFLQNGGFDWPVSAAERVIVHTQSAKNNLVQRGIAENKVRIISHGPLSLSAAARPVHSRNPRWTVVLFGQIKPYKGIDVLIDAVKHLSPDLRAQLRVIVAGAPQMNVTEMLKDIESSGLGTCVEMRLGRLDDQEMADLFEEADAFAFPYRQIDASGVYFLTSSQAKWTIASNVGIFSEDLRDGTDGRLLPPGDAKALAAALTEGIEKRPGKRPTRSGRNWHEIAEATIAVYQEALSERRKPS